MDNFFDKLFAKVTCLLVSNNHMGKSVSSVELVPTTFDDSPTVTPVLILIYQLVINCFTFTLLY